MLRLPSGVGDLHAHRAHPLRDGLADAAEPEDADRLATEFRVELRPALRPFARHGEAVEPDEAAARHHHERHGNIRDIIREHVRGVRHLEPALPAVVDGDAVVADTENRDDLERRQRVEQRCRCDRASALHEAADDRTLRRKERRLVGGLRVIVAPIVRLERIV